MNSGRWTWDSSLAAIVFASAVAGSSYTWFQLALHTNWVAWLAWVPFVAIDVGGLIFGYNWIHGRTVKVRVWGKITTLLAVTISVVGNGLEHAIAGGFLRVTMELTVAVGAIAPAVLFAVCHQWALKQPGMARSGRKVSEKATEHASKSVGVETAVPAPPAPPPTDIAERGQQRAVMVMWAQRQDELPPIKAIQNKFKVSQSTAKRVRNDARAAS